MTPDQLIDYIGRTESNGDYGAFVDDDNGYGSSYGLIQYNAGVGTLPELLKRMHKADPVKFVSIFGGFATGLLDTKFVRAGFGFAGLPKSEQTVLRNRFKAAGTVSAFQQLQRDIARKGYLEPAWKLAQQYGLNSERAAAMCFDIAVQRGIGWLRKWLKKFIVERADGADEEVILAHLAHDADLGLSPRRTAILRDPALSDAPWSMDQPPVPARPARPVLRLGAKGEAVKDLQRLLNRAPHLVVDGEFGPATMEAVRQFRHVHMRGKATRLDAVDSVQWAALEAAGGET